MPFAARVVMATYNQLPALRRAVRGYLRQTTKDFALTIADDGSRPDTVEFVRSFAAEAARAGLRVDHVWHEDVGWRKNEILNEAVRRSEGERLLIFTDGDCIPPARFVERHLAAWEPRSFHVGGRILLTEEASAALTEADVDAGRYESLVTAADRRDLLWRAWKSRWGVWLRRRKRPKVIGANMAIDRTVFDAVNGFDERFRSYGFGEDDDLKDRALRLRPRPPVKVLYGKNDVFHLWHPRPQGQRDPSRAYYETERPVRCEVGLARESAPARSAAPGPTA